MAEPIHIKSTGVVIYDKGAKDCKGAAWTNDDPTTGLRTVTCDGCSLHWTQPLPRSTR